MNASSEKSLAMLPADHDIDTTVIPDAAGDSENGSITLHVREGELSVIGCQDSKQIFPALDIRMDVVADPIIEVVEDINTDDKGIETLLRDNDALIFTTPEKIEDLHWKIVEWREDFGEAFALPAFIVLDTAGYPGLSMMADRLYRLRADHVLEETFVDI